MIRPHFDTTRAIALGVVAFYIVCLCITGLLPGECGLDFAARANKLNPVFAWEVRR